MKIDDCHDIGGNCTNTNGSFLCNCEHGFSGDGVSCQGILLSTFTSGLNQVVRAKTTRSHVVLRGNFSGLRCRLGQKLKRLGKSCSPQRKKFFLLLDSADFL